MFLPHRYGFDNTLYNGRVEFTTQLPSLIARATTRIRLCTGSTFRITSHQASVPFDLIVTAFWVPIYGSFHPPLGSPLTLSQPQVGVSEKLADLVCQPQNLALDPFTHTHALPSSPTLVTISRCGRRGLGLTCPGAPMFHFETHSSCLYDRPPIEGRIGSAFGTLRAKEFTLRCKSYQNMQ